MHTPADPPLVLVVEDDADAREMYEVMLAGFGFRIESAANGVEAVQKAQALHPRVILMDLTLPGIDGWEAGRRLKHDEGTRDIPIVALSGNPVDASGSDAGSVFSAALMKPCFPEDLLREVRRFAGQ